MNRKREVILLIYNAIEIIINIIICTERTLFVQYNRKITNNYVGLTYFL